MKFSIIVPVYNSANLPSVSCCRFKKSFSTLTLPFPFFTAEKTIYSTAAATNLFLTAPMHRKKSLFYIVITKE